MDFITANMLMFCIILLWICSGLLLWQLIKLQRKVDQLEYWDLDDLKERVQELEYFEDMWTRDLQTEQRCQHCQNRNDCPAYDTGVCYPCEHYEEKI